jgi:TonB family protein
MLGATAARADYLQVRCDAPGVALDDGEEATVILWFTVTPEGSATDVIVMNSSGYPGLDKAAVACALHQHFEPAMQDGRPVADRRRVLIWFDPPRPSVEDLKGSILVCVTNSLSYLRAPMHFSGVTELEFDFPKEGPVAIAVSNPSGNSDLDTDTLKCAQESTSRLARVWANRTDPLTLRFVWWRIKDKMP